MRRERRLIAWGVSAICKLSGCSALLMLGWMALAVLLGFALNPMGIFDSLSRRGRVVGAVNGAFLLGALTVFAPAFGWMVPVAVPAVCCGVSGVLTVYLEVTEFIPAWRDNRRAWKEWEQEYGAELQEWEKEHGVSRWETPVPEWDFRVSERENPVPGWDFPVPQRDFSVPQVGISGGNALYPNGFPAGQEDFPLFEREHCREGRGG